MDITSRQGLHARAPLTRAGIDLANGDLRLNITMDDGDTWTVVLTDADLTVLLRRTVKRP